MVKRLALVMLMVNCVLVTGVSGMTGAEDLAPLSPDERVRLETAVDRSEQREEAFATLRTHVLEWPGADGIDLDHLLLRRGLNTAALNEDPAVHRGELHLLDGTIAQSTKLSGSARGFEEWFVRGVDGETFIAFVPTTDPPAGRGEDVRVLGRFYKLISAEGRDGVLRTWPALVGMAMPASPGESGGVGPGGLLAGLVLAGAVVWAFLRRRAGKAGGGDAEHALAALRLNADEEGEEDLEGKVLATDPAEALAEMRARRSDGKVSDA